MDVGEDTPLGIDLTSRSRSQFVFIFVEAARTNFSEPSAPVVTCTLRIRVGIVAKAWDAFSKRNTETKATSFCDFGGGGGGLLKIRQNFDKLTGFI